MEGRNFIRLSFRKRYRSFTVEGDFTFEEGFNVILGPSGSGKTTVLRIIGGLLKPEEGFLFWKDRVLMDTSEGIFIPPQQRGFGFVFQENNLLPHLSVKENIEFAVKKAKDPKYPVELVRNLGLEAFESRKPHQLSTGERQRVAIIRALAFDPPVLLMDEPFSSLDFKIKLEIIEFIKDKMTQKLTIVVTHDPFEALLLADKVFLMEKGKKIEEGSRELIEEYFSELKEQVYTSSRRIS